ANGSITQQEHDDLQDLQDKVVAAKKAAQEAINLLDPSKDKEDLQAKLGEVDGIVVPEVTDVTPPETLDAEFNEAGTQVTGTTEPGATVEIKDANGSIIGTAVADEQGDYTADLTTPLTNGEAVTVTATDKAGNTTDPVDATAPDSTAPEAPVVEINEDGTQVTVTGEEGASVTITLPNGGPIEGTIENGSFTAELAPALTNGEDVSVTLTDGSNNESVAGTATAPDLTAPESVTAEFNEAGTQVTGTTEPGATVEIKDANGSIIGTAVADKETGEYTADLTIPLTNGETVTVTATDKAGNSTDPVNATARDTTKPDAPVVEISDTGEEVTVTGEKGTSVSITVPGVDKPITGTIGEEGSFTATLDPALTNGEEVSVTLKDGSGNTSESGTTTAPDLTGPDSITAQITDNGAAVTGQTEAGATVEVKDAAGKTIGTTKANADGNYTILLSPALTNSETITVTATDIAGNPGKSVDAVAPDLTAPSVPTIEVPEPTGANGEYNKGDVDENGNVTVTIKLPDDAEVDDVLILNGQEIAITEDMLTEGHQESVKPGSEVTASVKDAAGNLGMSATKQLATADTIAPEAPIITVPVPSAGADAEYNKGDVNDDGTITVNIKPRPDAQINDVLTIVVEGSQPVEVTITEDILLNGHDINIQPGSKVTASVKDAAGNVGSSEEATVPTADTDISTPQIGLENDTGSEDTDGITNDGTLSITGTDEGDEIVSVVAVKVDGSRLTLEATSEGSYVLPEGKYEKVVVTTQDAAGNTATAETGAITVDKTSPSLNISVDIIAEDDIINAAEAGSTITITGHVTGEYNADDTVTLTVNGNSNYSGKVTAEGSFSIEVTGSDLAEDSKVGVSVTTTDTAGNQGTAMAERPYEVDVVVPGQPVITFPENIDDNGYINIEENGTGYNVSNTPIRVTLPEGTEAGDIIELSTRLTDENSLETTQSIKIIVSETDITKGYAERLVNINSDTTGSTLEVTATVTDAAGNTSQDGTASIMIDTIAPQVAIEFDGIESSGSDSESYIATDSKHEVSFIFNEPVENFDLSKVNITSGGGTLSDLTGPIEINGEYVFKAIYTAPSSIPIGQESIEIELSIGNDVATDAAGNGNKDANDANNKVQIVVSKPAELESLVIKDDFISSSRPGFENTASNHYGVEGAYTGVVADSSVSNEQTELKGITNDTTPVVSIVLDGPVLQGQKVTVTGMQVDSQNNIIGDPIELDIANASMETNRVTGQVTYSWANEALPITDTKGREFVYKASITEVDGVTETANKEVSFILDTVAESPVVTGYDIIDGQGVITGKYSEPGGKVFVDVNKNGIFNFDEGEIATTVDQNGEWKLTLTIEQTKMIADIKNYNGSRSNPEVIEGAFDTYLPLSFVDKAGNTSTEFAEFYYFNNNDNGALSTSDLVPADRPETATGGWIEGQTGDYDGDGVGNWELRFDQNNAGQIILVERNIATYSLSAANRFSIITGKGDDVMIVKGVQNTNTSVYMGEGNDVYSIARLAGSGNAGSIVVDMGSGHNKILINGQAANDAIDLSTIKALGGDDLLDVTGGGIRRSNIDLGDGNNQILTYNLGGLGTTNITTGKDNDYLKVDNAVSSTNINLGDGINKIDINKYINSSTSINTGKHADTVNIGTYVSGSSTINLGGGDNTLTIGESVSGSASIVTGTGKDTVDIKTYLESASVKLGDGDNTLNIGSYVSGSASIKTGNDADTVTIGSYVNNSTVDLGDGGNTLTIGDYVSNSASIITGTGKDTVDIKNYVDNATIKLGDGGSELNIGTSVTGESYIETGSGKDIVTIGNEILHTTIDLGDGDNELTTGSDLRGTSSISAGSGNDIITIGGEVTSTSGGYLAHKVKIEAGDGDNVITVGKKEDAGTERGLYAIHGGQEAFIITGKDKDIITVHGDMVGKNAIINSGAGNDTVNVGGYAYAEAKIYTGEGRDTVNINYLGSSGGAPLVDTGADNDEVTIGTFSKGDIVLGAGEDKLSITTMTGGTVYTGTKEANEDNEVDTVKVDNLQGGIINLGANDVLTSFNNVDGINMTGGSVVFASGDDSSNTVKFNNLYGGTIDLGSGDDVIEFAGNNKIIDMTGTNNIKGGTGVDTLVMTGSGNSISANELFSVEIVDLGNKGNTFNTGLALAYNSSTGNLDSGYKGLFIKGGSNDTVNLGGLGWKDAGTTIEYGGNSYFEYSASNRTIYIDTNIEPVL
ncbi:Ig-like domain-containing protein, partial [Psychrobacter phenylpyruvicus]|uniref:Ig-like domain-containing protein n=1 Tax=Psychrobacter phenylpyruvicus TaxID=29432 RepID=UPI00048F03F3